jgi:thiol:disulfide interchange protein DsbD
MKLLYAFLLFVITLNATAQQDELLNVVSKGTPQMQVRMFTDYSSVKAGKQIKLGVHFDIEVGYYTYPKTKSFSHLPTKIQLNVPEGCKIINEVWPKTEMIFGREGEEEVYSDDFMVVYTIEIAKNCKKEMNLSANVSWQACDASICTVGKCELTTNLHIGKNKKSNLFDLFE